MLIWKQHTCVTYMRLTAFLNAAVLQIITFYEIVRRHEKMRRSQFASLQNYKNIEHSRNFGFWKWITIRLFFLRINKNICNQLLATCEAAYNCTTMGGIIRISHLLAEALSLFHYVYNLIILILIVVMRMKEVVVPI